jgi:tripartite-type tricarboxylate transporter receptor subunit TctC
MAEAGLPNFETTAWHGIAVRGGTPQPIIARLNATVLDIFNDAQFRKKWEALGTPVVAGTPEDFGRLVRTESVRLGRVVRDTGATAD